ncbi:MAG: hypothetical protein K2N21_05515, partial [Rikenellaceae bacterium]|nr:hypothetical protein [Rikenellaceae bacterium]
LFLCCDCKDTQLFYTYPNFFKLFFMRKIKLAENKAIKLKKFPKGKNSKNKRHRKPHGTTPQANVLHADKKDTHRFRRVSGPYHNYRLYLSKALRAKA